MISYKSINTGDTIYMLETSSVLEFKVIGKFITDNQQRLKLEGSDLTFEVEFNDVEGGTYFDIEEANATAMKYICDKVNELVKDLSNEDMEDYVDLNNSLEKYRDLFPELFI